MTPREKAGWLIERFYFSLPNNGSFTGPSNINDRWEEAKKCALIAVDEVFEFMKMDDEFHDCGHFANSQWVDYYIKLKQEIEKL